MLRQSLRNGHLQRLVAAACRTSAASSAWPPQHQEETTCSTSGSDASSWHRSAASFNPTHSLHFWSFGRAKTEPPPPPGGDSAFIPDGSDSLGSALASQQQEQPFVDPVVEPSTFPLPEGSEDVAIALGEAFDALEVSSIAAAKAMAWLGSSTAITALTTFHETAGLPWWASIVVFNLSLRLITFPLLVYSQKEGVKLMGFTQKLARAKKLQELASKARSGEEHARLTKAAQEEYKLQTKTHGSPVLTAMKLPAVMLTNGLLLMSVYGGVTSLMTAKVPSLLTGGMLWFDDLTIPDPTYLLCIACCVTTLAMVQTSMAMGGDMTVETTPEQVAQKTMLRNFMRVMAFVFIPAGYFVSAGTAVLWVSNSSFMVAQGLILRNNAFRGLVGLPSLNDLKKMQAAAAVVQKEASGAPPPGTAGARALAPAAALPTGKLLTAPPKLAKVPPPAGKLLLSVPPAARR